MKTFKIASAQGDVYIRKIDALPSNAIPVKAKDGFNVVAHSETGHNHVMEATKADMHSLPDSIMDLFLVVNDPVALEHLRSYDTHEPIMFEKGTYHIRRQREHTPEGWRRVED